MRENLSHGCDKKKIVICGVGGTGVALLSKVIATAAFLSGKDVKIGAMFGHAQREGSVTAHISWGFRGHKIPESADIVLALDLYELYRVLPKISENTTVICIDRAVPSVSHDLGIQEFPERKTILERVSERANAVYLLSWNGKEANIFAFGFLEGLLGLFGKDTAVRAIKECVKKRMEANLIAFEEGFKLANSKAKDSRQTEAFQSLSSISIRRD